MLCLIGMKFQWADVTFANAMQCSRREVTDTEFPRNQAELHEYR